MMFLVLSMVALVSCQQSAAAKIAISQAWGRSSPMMAQTGAVYVVIENQGGVADRLIGVSSAAAKTVEVHESYMEDGMMKMRPVDGGLEIPAGGKVEMKPGGYHIMLIDLEKPLEAGSKITVTLKFEKSGEIPVDVEIREQ
jgi:copper(I)-binding protein